MTSHNFTRKQMDKQAEDRIKTQDQIRDTWGLDRVHQNVKELCRVCAHKNECQLIPITLAGDPCPYFTKYTDPSEFAQA